MYANSDLGKLMILSPHMSDAVFACAEVIADNAGTVMVTLFSGLPPADTPLTEWDAAAGYRSTQEALAGRREEDRCALELLRATPIWLDFPESRYEALPCAIGMAEAIMEILLREQPATVMMPAGLSHIEHVLTHQACLLVRNLQPERNWFLYEDALYRRLPSLLQQRLIGLVHYGIDATPIAFDTQAQAERKHQAVDCYAGQLRALAGTEQAGHADIYAPEGYWRLTPAPLTC